VNTPKFIPCKNSKGHFNHFNSAWLQGDQYK